ncbi:Glucosamine-phosphate N-acetyltransferase-like protein [Cryptotrichosporon argae]
MDHLFDPSLMPSGSRQHLPSDLLFRPLCAADGDNGHLELLSVLTSAPQLSAQVYADRFAYMKACPDTYYVTVIADKATGRLVACGTLIIERKFVRGAGLCGHIEDIAVARTMQGRKLGLKIINALEDIAVARGCYKVILDCSKDNVAFYEKCGFAQKECQMVRYLPAYVPATPGAAKL